MNEQGDPLALLKLPSAIDGAREHGGLVANGVPLPRLPPLRLIIAGPAGAGKTTLARAILGDSVDTARVGELRGPTGSVVEYRPALHGDARRSRPEVSGGLLVVDVPSRNLAEWGMVVVDTPGVDAGAPDSFAVAREVARAACTAVLYVVPDRGCGEADVRALERLRSVPTVLIHNLRMLDVSAHSPPIIGLPTPTLAAPAALPLALSRLAGRGREWDCLREAIAVLWQLAMPEDHLINLLRITVEQQRRLRDNYAARLDAILVGRHSRVRAEQLQMTADLVHHRRQGALLEPLDDLLSGVAHLVLDLPAPGDARQSLGSRAREALNAYNVETVTRRSWSGSDALAAAASSGSAEDTIGSSLRQHREALGSFVAGIAEDDPLQLTMEEADLLRLLSDEIKSERFEIVVVGQFSAGKSSLINALLGVAPGVDLLPTKLEPTTTTVNHLMYGPEVTATVEWAESLDQMVLIETDTNHGQPCYRVHVEELRALSDWLDRGEVKLADCELLLSSGRTVPGLEAVQGLSRLTDAARIASASPRSFLYDDDKRGIGDDRTVPDCEFPYNVDIRRFAAAPREVPQTDSLTETIDIISKSPSIALRVSRLVIQHPNELLRHVTLVDTPGTDAPMPGHRIKTREAVVDDRDRAVIYCFDGDKPGSREDDDNIQFLHGCRVGSDELSRFFFVITKKGLHQRSSDQQEIRHRIRTKMNQIGLSPGTIYFTEVYDEHNDEYRQLAQDLNAFSLAGQRPHLLAKLRRVERLVDSVAQRHRDTIRHAEDGEAKRLDRLADLHAQRAQFDRVVSSFASDATWGLASVHRDGGLGSCGEVSDVDREIDALTTKGSFDHCDRILSGIEDANDAVERRIRTGWNASMSKLTSEVGGCGGRVVEVSNLSLPGEILPESAVRQAVGAITWRTRWQKFKDSVKDAVGADGMKWDADVGINRSRIERAWARSKEVAAQSVARSIDDGAIDVRRELDRIRSAIDVEIERASHAPDPAVVEAARRGETLSSQWLLRLDSMAEMIDTVDQ